MEEFGKKKRSDDRANVETQGIARYILEIEVGEKRGRLEYFPQIMKDVELLVK